MFVTKPSITRESVTKSDIWPTPANNSKEYNKFPNQLQKFLKIKQHIAVSHSIFIVDYDKF
jgi:hypothetical protein